MVRARVRVNYHHTLFLQITRNWLEKHSEKKSQVVAVLQMERVWARASALEIFSAAVSTREPTGFNKLSAMETSKAHYLTPFHVRQVTSHTTFSYPDLV